MLALLCYPMISLVESHFGLVDLVSEGGLYQRSTLDIWNSAAYRLRRVVQATVRSLSND